MFNFREVFLLILCFIVAIKGPMEAKQPPSAVTIKTWSVFSTNKDIWIFVEMFINK